MVTLPQDQNKRHQAPRNQVSNPPDDRAHLCPPQLSLAATVTPPQTRPQAVRTSHRDHQGSVPYRSMKRNSRPGQGQNKGQGQEWYQEQVKEMNRAKTRLSTRLATAF